MRRLLSALLCALCLGPVFAQEARLVVSTQLTPRKIRQLVFEVTGPADARVERISINLPRQVDTSLIKEGHLPSGWKLKATKHKFSLSGPARPLPFLARLEMGNQDAPLQIKAHVKGNGQTLYERDNMILKVLPPLEVRDKLRGLLALPPLLSTSDLVVMRLLNPQVTPPEGSWQIAGVPLKAEPDPDLKGGWILKLKVPELAPGTPISVRYLNPLDLCTVDVENEQRSRVIAPPRQRPEQPRLSKCAERGVLGGGLCVGGWFPEQARNGLLIDGEPAGLPITSSDQALFVPLQPNLKPGLHQLSGDPAFGFPTAEPITFEVIDIQAEMDKSELVEGQQAELSFFILGSKAPMKIRIINMTPEIIKLDGGDEQEIETFGGGGNLATRSVESKALGNFLIKYEIGGSRCPCTDRLDENNLISN